MEEKNILKGYEYAKDLYAEYGIDTDAAITKAHQVSISMHSWQGDDLIGYDGASELTGGIAATGGYPGRARTVDELRADMEMAMSLFPGKTKVSLHACHAELGGRKIGRDAYTYEQFAGWTDWAKALGKGLDLTPTFFSHPMMDGNFSLSSYNPATRQYWIDHAKSCRQIAAEMASVLGEPCVVDFWMPDGYKDTPVDTGTHRELMLESLDEIFKAQYSNELVVDAIESKLFGFGIESYTVMSHELAFGYAASRGKAYCIDAGHFHPTEDISDKFSAVLQYVRNILLHTSRGVRWDSDHVVTLTDDLQRMLDEIVRGGYLDRVYIAQDYFDASINRIACWVIAMRNTRKALLKAILEPLDKAIAAQRDGDFTSRLAILEENKMLPFAAVWDYYCLRESVPVGLDWLAHVKQYEQVVLSERE